MYRKLYEWGVRTMSSGQRFAYEPREHLHVGDARKYANRILPVDASMAARRLC